MPRCFASFTIVRPKWCSEITSASAVIFNSPSSVIPIGWMRLTSGFPFVNVPVLSNTSTSILANCSITSPPLSNAPLRAPFPIPATNDTGAEMTSAPGQAMTRKVSANSTFFVTNKRRSKAREFLVYTLQQTDLKTFVFSLLFLELLRRVQCFWQKPYHHRLFYLLP